MLCTYAIFFLLYFINPLLAFLDTYSQLLQYP